MTGAWGGLGAGDPSASAAGKSFFAYKFFKTLAD